MNLIRTGIALLAALILADGEQLKPIVDGKTLNGWQQRNGTARYSGLQIRSHTYATKIDFINNVPTPKEGHVTAGELPGIGDGIKPEVFKNGDAS